MGGVAVRGVDAQRSVDGERCEEKRKKKEFLFFPFEKPAEENKLDNISGTAGSKQPLVQRNTGNKQTPSTHSNSGSNTQEGIRALCCNGGLIHLLARCLLVK